MHHGAVVGMVQMGGRNPECVGDLSFIRTQRGMGSVDVEHARADDPPAGIEARDRHRSQIADMMGVAEHEPDLLARLAHRGGAQTLVLVVCPAAGKRDITGPAIPGAAGALDEAHTRCIGVAGKHDRNCRAPPGLHVRARLRCGEPLADLFNARHRAEKIPQHEDKSAVDRASIRLTSRGLTFSAHQYCETICGGAGATPVAHGTDAVHSHMTNSRLTDPEVLEWRFPVVLESFVIRIIWKYKVWYLKIADTME